MDAVGSQKGLSMCEIRERRFFALALCAALAVIVTTRARADRLAGRIEILWADPSEATSQASPPVFQVVTREDERVSLSFSDDVLAAAGGLKRLRGAEVVVEGAWGAARGMNASAPSFTATSVRVVSDPGRTAGVPAATPSQAWVSLPCKYSDEAAEPKATPFFELMYANAYPGLEHYWRESSRNALQLAGSTATPWLTLPGPRSYYFYDANGDGYSDLNLNRLFADCTAAADALVNFTAYYGVNIILNAESGSTAWGGGRWTTLDGEQRVWGATWLPPWAWQNLAVVEHEIGHGLGLPHSSGAYGLTYDNEWDVMSSTWANCERATHATYGCLGQHTIQFHRDTLGWLAPSETYVHAAGGTAVITLQRANFPAAGGYLAAKVFIDADDHYYSIELRQRTGYDVKLPGEGVIIHEVDELRSRPAWVVDSDGNGDTGDAGALWTAGETFRDLGARVVVRVDSIDTASATLTITAPRLSACTLTVTPSPATAGVPVNLNATVTPGATGTVAFYDGATLLADVPLNGSTASFTTSALTPGDHEIRARYSGDATFASGLARESLRVRVPTTAAVTSSPNPSASGESVVINVTVTPAPEGWVLVYSGSMYVCGGQVEGGAFQCSLNSLAPGTHSMTARYEGSWDHGVSTSPVYAHVVTPPPGAPAAISATAVSSNQVNVTWTTVDGAQTYVVWRQNSAGWLAFWKETPPLIDTDVSADRAYAYQVTAITPAGQFASVMEVATTFTFTDDPLVPNTPIRAAHVEQLRLATNALLQLSNIQPVVFDEAVVPGASFRTRHIADIREGIGAARAAMLLPPVSWTPPSLPGSAPISAAQIQQMRSALK